MTSNSFLPIPRSRTPPCPLNKGHAIVECSICDRIIHNKCFDKENDTYFENEFFCANCKHLATKRYNPFKIDFENDDLHENDILLNFAGKLEAFYHKIQEISCQLRKCKYKQNFLMGL